MNSTADGIALAIEQAARILMFYTEDLKGADWLHRPCPGANCAAWTVGHLVLSSRGMLTKAGFSDLPPLPAGFEKRFTREDDAPKCADFGDTSILRPLFEQSHKLMVDHVRSIPPEKLKETLSPGHPIFGTIGSMLAFAPSHIATHAGQISTIRRSLGRPPLV